MSILTFQKKGMFEQWFVISIKKVVKNEKSEQNANFKVDES